MSDKLDEKLVEVGYFLSRLGKDEPPQQLNAKTWKEAYEKFYPSLGQNKDAKQFQNSLKNLRDHFDSHLKNNRMGWKDNSNRPEKLSTLNQEVFLRLEKLEDLELWDYIRPLAVTSYDANLANKKNVYEKKLGLKYFSSEFSGKKRVKAKEDSELFVYHGLVIDSLKEFASNNFEYTVIFNTQKIDLAIEYNHTITALFEVKTSSDSQSIYTAVGQLFMHSAGIEGVHKYIVLPKSEVGLDLTSCLGSLKIKIIWYEIAKENCSFYFN